MPPVAVVLDSDPFFRDLQRYLLGQRGWAVVAPESSQGFTAEFVAAQRPALVVTEILLPGTDGLELVRELRTLAAMQGVPVVVYSVLRAEARALEAGANSFVEKPLMRDNYWTTIEEAVQAAGSEVREVLP